MSLLDVEQLFNKAADCVQANALNTSGKKPDDKSLLELYAFYKVATIGPCNEPQPGMFNLKGKAKWSAWKQVSNISKKEAMEAYIEKVKLLYDFKVDETSPEETELKSEKKISSSSDGTLGNAVSTMLRLEEDENEDETIFKWAKDNNIQAIKSWLKNKNNDINCQDEEGLTPLHWSVDRGHIEACKLFLLNNPDLTICDSDGQTPLDYAITCEHSDIIDLIEKELHKN